MASNATVIHLRFAPDGSVTEIGERPASLTAQQWFDRLSDKHAMDFQACRADAASIVSPRRKSRL